MKLSHLSLAILSAIALAACGGSSSDDHTTDPNANKPGATDQTPKQPEDKKDEDKKEDTAKDDAKIVDPTGDQVVDNITLAKKPTTASQQYLRGKASQFDRIANPNEPASATVLSGITLDEQNPQLTNIVIGRIDDKNSKGERVQVAFYAGSDSNEMESVRQSGGLQSLQAENKANALVGGLAVGNSSREYNSLFGLANSANKSFVMGSIDSISANPVISNNGANAVFANYFSKYDELQKAYHYYEYWLEAYKVALAKAKATTPPPTFDDAYTIKDAQGKTIEPVKEFKSAAVYLGQKINSYNQALQKAQSAFASLNIKPNKGMDFSYIDGTSAAIGKTNPTLINIDKLDKVKSNIVVPRNSDLEKYGAGLYWYTYEPGNFNPVGWGDYIDPVKGVVGAEAGDATHLLAGEPTTGLVGIYKSGAKWIVRGSEDKNVRTTRIFGHYYLDPGSEDDLTLNPEGLNSWNSARTFITGVDTKGDPNQYGLGAAPITLNHVQYGRVTATIDDNSVAGRQGTSDWIKEHQDFANRDPKYANDADNFYFYRGTNATSIEDMAKLPTDATIAYQGHALMYGIDNSFHGGGQELPNAFGNQQSYGLGNFVKANLNMGSKKFDGYVYNVWGSPSSAAVKEDKLVEFSGDVTGNTVVGTANLAYDTSKTGDLRASFYGAGAEEVGGAINSVKREDPYGPIGWGGVFGAQRTTSGSSAWLVSSEKK